MNMIFQNLFKPKWQHSDPQVRKLALQKLDLRRDEDRLVLIQLAQGDSVPDVRWAALKRVTDGELLWERAQHDGNGEVRALAWLRFVEFLCGRAPHSPPLAVRRQRFDSLSDAKIVEAVARQGAETELRLAAVQRLEREALLGDVAMEDADPEVRYAAVRRIRQKSTLERVAKSARGKDKRVSGFAKEQLAALAAEQERPKRLRQEAKQICAGLEALTKATDWPNAKTRFDALCNEWQATLGAWDTAQDGAFDADIVQRFERARALLETKYAEYEQTQTERRTQEAQREPLRAAKRACCEQLEREIAALQANTPAALSLDDEQRRAEVLAQTRAAWSGIDPLPGSEEQVFQMRFAALTQQLESRIQECARYRTALHALQEMQARINALLEREDAIEESEMKKLEREMGTLFGPQHFVWDEHLLNDTRRAMEQLRAKQAAKMQRVKADTEAFKDAMAQLEAALEEGKSQPAMELHRRMQQAWNRLPERETNLLRKQGYGTRFQAATKQVRELSSWKRWAGAPVKERMVEEMETLARALEQGDEPQDLHAVARRIRAAHEEWKRLGATENESAQELWERFRKACRAAYAPCKAYFAQERRQHAEHRAQKEAMCQGLEEFIAQANWEQMDWKKVERMLRGARAEWEKIGPVERTTRAALNKRFRAVLHTLAKHLQEERKRNTEKKEALIKRMQALVEAHQEASGDSAPLRDAITQAKKLQQQWKEIGSSLRSQELWKQLQAAGDALFAKRQALNQAQDQERSENLQRKQALCASLEQWAQLQGDELKAAHGKADEAKKEWNKIGPLPKEAEPALAQRFQQACRAFERSEQQGKIDEEQAQWTLLERKAHLCADVERVVDESIAQIIPPEQTLARVTQAQQTWQGWPSLADVVEAEIQRRFQFAVETALRLGPTPAPALLEKWTPEI